MPSIVQNLREGSMDQNQGPKRPGGEMKSAQSSEPSKSQLLPFASNALDLTTKPYFLPGLVVAILVPLLFSFIGGTSTIPISYRGVPVNVPTYTVLLALALTAGGAFAIYRMIGKAKPWWAMPAAGAFSGALLMTPFFFLISGVFTSGVPPVIEGYDGIVLASIKMFFRAGLPEEIYKAIPILIGVYIGKKLSARMPSNHPARQLAVIEPLDGILIGAASGLGFAFVETLMQYVPRIILMTPVVAQALVDALAAVNFRLKVPGDWHGSPTSYFVSVIPEMFSKLVEITHQPDLAALIIKPAMASGAGRGLELVIPRLLSDVMGHAAYSGILGYFIGLAAMKPHQWLKTVAIGLGIAAGLHGIWDGAGYLDAGTFWLVLLSLAAFVGLTTLIMKAREISPNRSQLVASQIIDRMAGGLSRSHLVPQGFLQGSAVAGAAPAAKVTPVPARSITYDDGPAGLVIEIGTARVPVNLGTRLYERQAPGTRASRGDSVVGEINANPNDPGVLGIKNHSEQIWHVTTIEGERRDLAPGRSVRLMRGMRILIGDLDAEIK